MQRRKLAPTCCANLRRHLRWARGERALHRVNVVLTFLKAAAHVTLVRPPFLHTSSLPSFPPSLSSNLNISLSLPLIVCFGIFHPGCCCMSVQFQTDPRSRPGVPSCCFQPFSGSIQLGLVQLKKDSDSHKFNLSKLNSSACSLYSHDGGQSQIGVQINHPSNPDRI